MKPTLVAAVGATLAAMAIGTALLPTQMHVSRSAVVHGSPEEVTSLVATYPNRLAWVPWTEIDPEAAYTFTGVAGTPGSTMSWTGDEIGTATLELQRVDPGREVVSTLTYEAPFAMTSTDRFLLEDLGDGSTRVTWTAEAPLAGAPDRLFGLFADALLGPDYAWGLDRLDAALANSHND